MLESQSLNLPKKRILLKIIHVIRSLLLSLQGECMPKERKIICCMILYPLKILHLYNILASNILLPLINLQKINNKNKSMNLNNLNVNLNDN